MKPETREKLEQVIRVLESVSPDQLDLSDWVCETAACAIGWCAQDKWFNERGLMLASDDYEIYPIYAVDDEEPFTGFSAVREFLGIIKAENGQDDLAYWMFDSDSYHADDRQNPQAVIRHIKEVLAKGESQ